MNRIYYRVQYIYVYIDKGREYFDFISHRELWRERESGLSKEAQRSDGRKLNNNGNNNTNNNNNNNNNDEVQLRPNAKIPFIPGGISYKLKRALNKAGCSAHVTAGQKLQSLLCAPNKTRPNRLDNSGIYKYHCPNHKKDYVGETKRSFKIRDEEHRKAAASGKWSHSGLTQHMERCDATIQGPQILFNANKRDKNPKFDLRVREALFIRRFNSGPGKGMNEDLGSYVTTTQWEPIFNRIRGGGGQGVNPSSDLMVR